uniref:Uncharacterized protein n=1 Tax=uncultured bacterium esnapd14 TaxID=1366594 RepID=S5UCQ6_9BACT|nr:hypothetical protein [uncultured bacterium esnapd14]
MLLATMVVIAASVAVPTSATAALDVSGTWWSVDREGVEQTMTIERTSNVDQYRVHATSAKSSVCGGMEANASGLGYMPRESSEMTVEYRVNCMMESVAVCSFAAKTAYNFDPERSSLRDQFDVTWRRISEPVNG